MVLFFSGTGNSRHIARLVADRMGQPLFDIHRGIKTNTFPTTPGDMAIVCVPTYAWRVPRIVSDWMRKSEAFSGRGIYFLLTCGGGIGNAQKYAKALCAQCGARFLGCGEILMPENYIARYDCPPAEESARLVTQAEQAVEVLFPLMQAGEPFPERIITPIHRLQSGLINDIFYPFCVGSRKFRVSDDCIGCGQCVRLCPLNNIQLKDSRPVWQNRCTHCMACICHCPTEAIEYGNISIGKRRYRCPE